MLKPRTALLTLSLFLGLAALSPARAEMPLRPGFETLAAEQAAKNIAPGARSLPARSFAPPTEEVSPGLQALIAGPYPPHMNAAPKDAAAWFSKSMRTASKSGTLESCPAWISPKRLICR